MSKNDGAHLRLRSTRMSNGYPNAKAFADKHNINYTTYISHENGKNGISDDFAEMYSKIFNIPVEWLLYGTNNDDLPNTYSKSRQLNALLPVALPKIFEIYLKTIGKWDDSVDYDKLFTKSMNTFKELASELDNIEDILDKTATICVLRESELKKSILKEES